MGQNLIFSIYQNKKIGVLMSDFANSSLSCATNIYGHKFISNFITEQFWGEYLNTHKFCYYFQVHNSIHLAPMHAMPCNLACLTQRLAITISLSLSAMTILSVYRVLQDGWRHQLKLSKLYILGTAKYIRDDSTLGGSLSPGFGLGMSVDPKYT